MEPARHPKTKRFPDCVRPCDEHGKIILTEKERESARVFISEEDVTEIYDGKEFDLDNPHDAAWWEAIKYSKKIASDRWERDSNNVLIIDGNQRRYGNAEFYVERPGVETKVRNDRKRLIHEAKEYIYRDNEESLRQKLRLLGNSMPNLPLSDVEDYLVSIAERTPQQITEIYTGTDTHLRLFLLDATDKRVIYIKDKLYYYGDNIVLGATDSAVLLYFKNPGNKRIVDMIRDEVYPDYAIPVSHSIDTLTEDELLQKPTRAKTK